MSSNTTEELQPYIDCIGKQLEEVELLSSIYCTPGEFRLRDASVISDFHEFLAASAESRSIATLKAQLDYNVELSVLADKQNNRTAKLDVHIELPHLYPLIEHAIVIIHTTLLSKAKELYFKAEIERYIASMDKQETYVFQVLSWLPEQFEIVQQLQLEDDVTVKQEKNQTAEAVLNLIDFERLWIYSHHIKSKTKRQEIIREARNLELSGFSRPGKPGIICVEGVSAHVQEFWRIIRSMQWQKIGICKSEILPQESREKLQELRRFQGFHEQIYVNGGIMDMSEFIKFLEAHNFGNMKHELFGLA